MAEATAAAPHGASASKGAFKGGLYFKTLQKATSVTSTSCGSITEVGRRQILVNRQNSLEVWEEAGDGDLSLKRELTVYERVEHSCVIKQPKSTGPDFIMLVTSDDRCTLLQWSGETLEEVASALLEAPPAQGSQPPPARRLDGIRASWPHGFSNTDGQSTPLVVAVAIYEGYVHMVRMSLPVSSDGGGVGASRPKATITVSTLSCARALSGGGGGPTQSRGGVSSIVSMEFVPASVYSTANPDGHHLLCVLHAEEGYESRVLHLHCVAVDLLGNSMRYGPWHVRNVHPTTSLVMSAAFVGPSLFLADPSSALVVSSRGVTWYGGGVERGLLPWSLSAAPTCVEVLCPGVLAVGDSAGGITVADVRAGDASSWSCFPVRCPAPSRLAVPASLSYVPRSSVDEDAGGLLFVGSHYSASQVLEVPAAALRAEAGEWGMQQAEAIPSLAPVVAAMTMRPPEGSGTDETCLLMCCGVAPTGSLRRGHMGAALQAISTDGPELDSGVRLLPLRDRWGGEHHSLLLFSFGAVGCTDALRVEGEAFEQAQVDGLDHSRASLHAANVPGDHLAVQATVGEVRVLGLPPSSAPGLRASWAPEGGRHLDLCASDGGSLAVSCGADVFCLAVDEGSGQVAALGHVARHQQVSALGVFTVAPGDGATPVQLLVLGQWVDNTVAVLEWPSMNELGSVRLEELGQPRSVVLAQLRGQGGAIHLLVGTAGGDVVYYTVSLGGGRAELASPHRVHVGDGAVALELVPASEAAPAHVYAHGSSDVVLWSPPPLPRTTLKVARVHGSDGLHDVAPLHTAEMPHAMVWVSARRRLVFGVLDMDVRLRWDTAPLGDTPVRVAHHRSLGLVVALTEDASGRSWLRLLQGRSLQEVVALQLDPDHCHCAVLCAELPCTSRAPTEDDEGVKEFIVLSSFIQDSSSAAPARPDSMIGMLSVLEVVRRGGPSAAEASYQLVLHGTAFMPSVCYSLATISPSAPDAARGGEDGAGGQHAAAMAVDGGAEGGGGAAGKHVEPLPPGPLLLAGSHDGVVMYRLLVDDAGRAGSQAVSAAIDEIRQVGAGEGGGAGGSGEGGGAALAGRLPAEESGRGRGGGGSPSPEDPWQEEGFFAGLGEQRWEQRLVLEPLGRADTPSGGCVSGLSTAGSTALASEFMGSVTLLEPDPTCSSRVRACSSDRLPVFAHAAAPMTDQLFLLAAHPYGLVLMERDPPAEAAFAERSKLEEHRNFEAGGRGGGAGRAAGGGAGGDAGDDGEGSGLPQPEAAPPALLLRASCRLPQLVAQFCPGRLGLRASPLSPPREDGEGEAEGGESLIFVTSGGQVGSALLLGAEEHSVLSRAQEALEGAAGGPHTCAAGSFRHDDMWRWRCPMPDSDDDAEAAVAAGMGAEAANAAALDGDFLGHLLVEGAEGRRALLEGAGEAKGGKALDPEVVARTIALADFRLT